LFVAVLTVLGASLIPTAARAERSRNNDPYQLGALNAVAAWQQATGSGVVVAVLDSGVDATHPDLVGQVLPGLDLVDGSSDGRVDPVGHGTSVAALIAGRRDGSGVVGMAPDARILPVRVLDWNNRYEDAAVVAQGVRWAIDHGAQVINLSLGGLAHSEVLAEALAYAADHDVVVVACTGNINPATSDREVWYPAREPGIVAVTGLRGLSPGPTASGGGWLDNAAGGGSGGGADALWAGSLTGPQTVLSAPAVDLLGARPGGYWRVQGTSFATPLVTGTAALVRSKFPRLTAANVINRLIRTATDLGPAGRDDRYGFGQVNPLAAVGADVAPVIENPLTGATDSKDMSGQGARASENPAAANTSSRQGGGAPALPATAAAPAASRNAAGETPGHHRAGGVVNAGSTGTSMVLVTLLLAAAAGSVLARHPHLRRYLHHGRHTKNARP
jgi:subtilisin family serine protease